MTTQSQPQSLTGTVRRIQGAIVRGALAGFSALKTIGERTLRVSVLDCRSGEPVEDVAPEQILMAPLDATAWNEEEHNARHFLDVPAWDIVAKYQIPVSAKACRPRSVFSPVISGLKSLPFTSEGGFTPSIPSTVGARSTSRAIALIRRTRGEDLGS